MAEAATSTGTKADPPRFWWLKRLTVGLVMWLAAVVGLRYLAAEMVGARLRTEIGKIKASGEPIEPSDFAEPRLSEEENAAAYLERAGLMIRIDPQEKPVWDFLPQSRAYSGAQLPVVEAVLKRNETALKMVRQARGKNRAAWGVMTRDFVFWQQLRVMYNSDILDVAANYAHQQGRDDEAVEYLRDLLMLASALDQEPLLPAAALAAGTREWSALSASAMAATLQINVSGKPPKPHAASEEQVRKLIDELLDERQSPRSGLHWLFQAERMWQQEYVRVNVDHPDWRQASIRHLWSWTKLTKLRIWLLRPMFKRDAIRLLRISDDALAAERQSDYLAALRRLGPAGTIKRSTNPLGLELVSGAVADYQWMFYRYHSVSQKRRQGAVKLAERLFEVKNGRLSQPVELVPDYLSSLPLDPLSAGWTVAGTPAPPTTAPSKN